MIDLFIYHLFFFLIFQTFHRFNFFRFSIYFVTVHTLHKINEITWNNISIIKKWFEFCRQVTWIWFHPAQMKTRFLNLVESDLGKLFLSSKFALLWIFPTQIIEYLFFLYYSRLNAMKMCFLLVEILHHSCSSCILTIYQKIFNNLSSFIVCWFSRFQKNTESLNICNLSKRVWYL